MGYEYFSHLHISLTTSYPSTTCTVWKHPFEVEEAIAACVTVHQDGSSKSVSNLLDPDFSFESFKSHWHKTDAVICCFLCFTTLWSSGGSIKA